MRCMGPASRAGLGRIARHRRPSLVAAHRPRPVCDHRRRAVCPALRQRAAAASYEATSRTGVRQSTRLAFRLRSRSLRVFPEAVRLDSSIAREYSESTAARKRYRRMWIIGEKTAAPGERPVARKPPSLRRLARPSARERSTGANVYEFARSHVTFSCHQAAMRRAAMHPSARHRALSIHPPQITASPS